MSPVRMGEVEVAIRLAMELVGAFNRRDLAALRAGLAEGCVVETPDPGPSGGSLAGREVIAGQVADCWASQPEIRLEAEAVAGAGLWAVLRFRVVAASQPDRAGLRCQATLEVQQGQASRILVYRKGGADCLAGGLSPLAGPAG